MDYLLATLLGHNGVSLDDPIAMQVSAPELERAHNIKRAVEGASHLTNLTDFEYVQIALTHPTNEVDVPISRILDFVAQMQAFREEYDIQETADEGEACIAEMTRILPGVFLGIHYLPGCGNCISINDWAAFYPSKIKSPQQYSAIMKGSYYRFQCMSPTFMAIREGMSTLFECQGASFDNFDFSFFEQINAELYHSYPKSHKEMFFVNSPSAVNLAYGLWKKYMSKNMKETFHLGYQINGLEGVRIDELFKIPSEEQGRIMMIQKAKDLLNVRYHYQSHYTLPPLDATG